MNSPCRVISGEPLSAKFTYEKLINEGLLFGQLQVPYADRAAFFCVLDIASLPVVVQFPLFAFSAPSPSLSF